LQETKSEKNFQVNDPVVVIGFGQMGQVGVSFAIVTHLEAFCNE